MKSKKLNKKYTKIRRKLLQIKRYFIVLIQTLEIIKKRNRKCSNQNLMKINKIQNLKQFYQVFLIEIPKKLFRF